MRTTSTFTVTSFEPAGLQPPSTVTGAPVGVARMVKQFAGGLEGTAETLFTSAYDQERGIGTTSRWSRSPAPWTVAPAR